MVEPDVQVGFANANFVTVTRRMTLARASFAATTLRCAAFDCLVRIPLNRKVRLLGVRLSNLESSGQRGA